MLGHSSPAARGTFEVQVFEVGNPDAVQNYTTTNRPGTRIEDPEPGVDYAVRLREVTTVAKPSEWSESLVGTPLGATDAPALNVRGVIVGTEAAAIMVAPAAGTERNRITASGPGVDRRYDIERAAVEVLPIDGFQPESVYDITVAAEGADGVSQEWTGTAETGPIGSSPTAPTGVDYGNRGNDAFVTWDPQSVQGFLVTRTSCDTQRLTVGFESAIGAIGQLPG